MTTATYSRYTTRAPFASLYLTYHNDFEQALATAREAANEAQTLIELIDNEGEGKPLEVHPKLDKKELAYV